MRTRLETQRTLRPCATLAVGLVMALAAGCGSAPQPTNPPASAGSHPATQSAPAEGQTASKPLRPVTLMLDWTFEGDHAPFFYGIAQGLYRQVGLDVKIVPGKGSTSTIEQVAQNNADFGFADMASASIAITQGVKVKVVDGYFQKSP